MAKRRKLSELTAEETATVVDFLKRFQDELDEEDEDGQEVVAALGKVVNKLKEVKHVPFSDATILSLTKANIKVDLLELSSLKEGEARKLGDKTTVPDALTLEETKKNIVYTRKYVSFETEAGCRILINVLLIHAASNLSTSSIGAAIAPEFRIPETPLESGGSAYGGAVDYLMVLGEPWARNLVLQSPKLAFTNKDILRCMTCNIYEAKPDNVLKALPQVVMAAVVQSQRFRFQTFRGCVTTGEEWLFFVYSKDVHGSGGTVSWLPSIRLERDLSGLPLVLGLLCDWIENGQKKQMRFCTYAGPSGETGNDD
ncbi:hypothetical protein B0H10DRAFT_2180230 [Mycena sp. CBHHK59/15]|nr:hypothetical protein B0H10DRAFT_2180230 [Mycena sp. CBHHK59/15]